MNWDMIMFTWPLIICVCQLTLAQEVKLPTFKQPEAEPETVSMPEISAAELSRSFQNAANKSKRNLDLDLEFKKQGLISPESEVSLNARMQGYASDKTMQLHRAQQSLEYVNLDLIARFNLTREQIRFGLPKLALPPNTSSIQQCLEALADSLCNASSPYRTADGSCNNLQHPSWGNVFYCYGRLLPPAYADGVSSLRISEDETPLPNPADVSKALATDLNRTSRIYSHMAMQWGQFVAHDVAEGVPPRPVVDDAVYNCCPLKTPGPRPEACASFVIPKDDTFVKSKTEACADFVRITACPSDCKLGAPRRQVNQQTAFLDSSVIYGTSVNETLALRTLKGGLLAFQETKEAGHMLPASQEPTLDQCSATMPKQQPCFQSGDDRVNNHVALTAMHTIMFRHHNQVARLMAQFYPNHSDEELFQVTRKILGAQMQVITYKELLPLYLGPAYMTFFQLQVQNKGFTSYNASVDPTIVTEFATGAFRFGHTLIQNLFSKVDDHEQVSGTIDLRTNQFHPIKLYEGKLDEIVRGLYHQGAQKYDRHFASAVTKHLLQLPGAPFGVDLVAINIQRGREHGLPSYSKLHDYCFNTSIDSFDDLSGFMSRGNIKRLKKVYKSVHDIDAYIAGVMETPIPNALVGPTFGCYIGLQFQRLKFGDRFYFEHGGEAGSFTPGQLEELRKTTLANVLCDSSDAITKITANVFQPISSKNLIKECCDLEIPNFENWLEK